MSLKVYIAARSARREKAQDIARRIVLAHQVVTSRWVTDDAVWQAGKADPEGAAMTDLDDMERANGCLHLYDGQGVGNLIEFGYMLKAGKWLWVVGGRAGPFGHLRRVVHFPTVDEWAAEYLRKPALKRSKPWASMSPAERLTAQSSRVVRERAGE